MRVLPGGLDSDEFGREFDEEVPEALPAPAVPSFTVEQGTFVSSWPAPTYVTLEFDHIRTNRDGGLTGELNAHYTAPGLGRAISEATHVTLTGSRARQELAGALAKRLAAPTIDWPTIVERATSWTVRAFRTGEPAILLRDAPEPIDAGYLVWPLLVARQPTIWFGDGGNGKSLLALAAALTVHADRADLLGVPAAARLKVAYLDWEYDAWEHRKRMRALVGTPEPDLLYLRCSNSLSDEADRLRAAIRQHGVEYVVVDSVAAACGGEPESAEVALRFFNALRALGVGSLCIAHTTKSQEAQERPFGSAFWGNMARSTWLVQKQQEPSANELAIGLFNKKANSGPLSAPVGFRIQFGEDGQIRMARTDVRDVPGLAGNVSLGSRLRHALKAGPKTYQDLADELDAKLDAVRQAAHRGARPGGAFVILESPEGQKQVALRAAGGEA